ncbi:hypothetical protein AAFF_G00092810 [Aldrovandia affinis]|uniref:Uncharacterized protein n=1 Tax=Aldrovandia affinis TaxID=143900 RepID=A0AAD7T2N6_9TELE|nr:hypothetical protein AAFF_G00092810 [Aldrovandia affinis]
MKWLTVLAQALRRYDLHGQNASGPASPEEVQVLHEDPDGLPGGLKQQANGPRVEAEELDPAQTRASI